MTDPQANPMNDNDRIESQIRDHLASQEAKVDASAMLAGVRRRMMPAGPSRLRRTVRWGVGASAVAAAILLAIVLIPTSSTAVANPETVIREARQVVEQAVDRCYFIETDWGTNDPNSEKRFPFLSAIRQTKLWTRGDRFYLETTFPDGRVAKWGRDASGGIWLTPGPRFGLQFGPEETVEGLSNSADLMSMRVDALLSELLWGFDLSFVPADDPSTYRVLARAKAYRKNSILREVTIDIDRVTKKVEKVALKRFHRFMTPPTESRVTFTHTEDANLGDSLYTLEGHLEPNARILGANFPGIRADALSRFLNRKLLPWPPPFPEKKGFPKG